MFIAMQLAGIIAMFVGSIIYPGAPTEEQKRNSLLAVLAGGFTSLFFSNLFHMEQIINMITALPQ